MGLVRWFTKNWANTREPTHPDLSPIATTMPPESAAEAVTKAVASLPRWRLESEFPGELRLTRRTRVMRFVDDVTVTVQANGAGSLIHAESRSRMGVGDLGQNRRNILELWAAVRNFL